MPETPPNVPQPRDHVIWSDEHKAFWRPDSMGYTNEFISAGRYTREEAVYTVSQSSEHKRAFTCGPCRVNG